MNAKRTLSRAGRAAAIAVTALALGGCGTADPAATAAPVSATPAPVTPGRASVEVPGVSLHITGATLHLDSAGDGNLVMRVSVGSGAPEHLAMIATHDGGRAVLRGGRAADGSMTSAGILVQPDSSVDFGAKNGPTAVLRDVHVATGRRTLPLTLLFGVAGTVRLDARVTNGG